MMGVIGAIFFRNFLGGSCTKCGDVVRKVELSDVEEKE
jgi:hypothetical protein